MTTTLEGPEHRPASGGAPKKIVLLLHGLGADGDDLIGLAPHIAPALPDAVFLSPHAPFPCDMAPYGRQWFSFQDRSPEMVLAGVQAAVPFINAFIDGELARTGLTADRLALVGFSQGTMMSLFVAPRRAPQIACVVGYSGRVIAADLLAAELRSKPPVLLVHGQADGVVPFESLALSEAALKTAGIPVTALSRPRLGHSIDEVGLSRGGQFLAEHLGRSVS